MRLAAGGGSFPMIPLTVSMDLIANMGIEGYDLLLQGESTGLLEDVRSDVPYWAGRLEEQVRGRGLEFADLQVIVNAGLQKWSPNHPEASEREAGRALLEDMVELAVRAGAPGITMLPGTDWPDESHEDSLARAGEELQRRAAHARDRGVILSVEPHIGSVCAVPDDIATLLELAPDLELTLDYTHYIPQGFKESELERFIPKARHFHARGSKEGGMQIPVKDDTIDYERAIDLLNEAGYDNFVAIDYVWVQFPGLNNIDVVSEMVLMRDRLRAKFAGETWTYPNLGEMDFGD